MKQDDMPQWMVDIEKEHFQSARDTGVPGLGVWNLVRRAHGFEPLSIDDLWIRHARNAEWNDEQLVQERRGWEEFSEFERLSELREAYRREQTAINALPATNQEFFAKRRARLKL